MKPRGESEMGFLPFFAIFSFLIFINLIIIFMLYSFYFRVPRQTKEKFIR